MPNYANGVIYKVISANAPNLIYYGSTARTLEIRLDEHVYDARPDTRGTCTSRHVIHAGAYSIHDVQPAPCSSKKELVAIERQFIEGRHCVNKKVPGRTNKEYKQANADIIKKKDKAYREANAEVIKKRKKEYREATKENSKAYRKANSAAIKKQQKAYHQANKETRNALVNARAAWRRSFGYWYTRHQYGTLCDIQPDLFL